MSKIVFANESFEVDAALVAEAFGLKPDEVLARLRDGTMTSLCEKGQDEDAGRYRLSFFSTSCRFSLIVDESGALLQRLTLDYGDRPLPAGARRPG